MAYLYMFATLLVASLKDAKIVKDEDGQGAVLIIILLFIVVIVIGGPALLGHSTTGGANSWFK